MFLSKKQWDRVDADRRRVLDAVQLYNETKQALASDPGEFEASLNLILSYTEKDVSCALEPYTRTWIAVEEEINATVDRREAKKK